MNSPTSSYGDFEQVHKPSLREINYLDMYILGSTGKNRFQVQVLNQYDPCCFEGTYYLHYEPIVEALVEEFEEGSYEVICDTVNLEHRVSEFSMKKIYEILSNEQDNL